MLGIIVNKFRTMRTNHQIYNPDINYTYTVYMTKECLERCKKSSTDQNITRSLLREGVMQIDGYPVVLAKQHPKHHQSYHIDYSQV